MKLPALLLLFVDLAASAGAVDGSRAVAMDGGTFSLGSKQVRILNIDAPDILNSHCLGELVAGIRARERLTELLRAGRLDIVPDEHDRYGRLLARVSVDGQDVGQILLNERLVLPRQDGPEAEMARIRHWCG